MDKPMTEDTVHPADAGQPARAMSPEAAPGLVAAQSRQRMRDGTELLLRTWEPDPRIRPAPLGCVLLVHGLAEHSGRYQHVAELLCGLGLRVRGYDQRGHGASGGARMVAEHPDAYLDDLAEIHDAAVRAWGELPILVGHSMGGLVAARFATARIRPVRALVLSSPALALRLSPAMLALHRVLLTLAPRLRVPNPIDARMLSHDPQVVARYRADALVQTTITAGVLESFIHGMAQAQAEAARLQAPMLMLVGGADRIVDPAGSRTFFEHAPADLREQAWFEHGYHEIFNEAEPLRSEVFAALTQWLRRHLVPPQH